MSDPDKLIVVGMRYQKGAQDFLANTRPIGRPVTLTKEFNPQGINNVGYLVSIGARNLGYIRNPDIGYLSADTYTNYEITSIQNNYLVLKLKHSFKVDDRCTVASMADNPCSEVPVGYTTLGGATTLSEAESRNMAFKQEYEASYNEKIKETKMNTNSMRDSFFREVKNAVLDITTGGFGITTPDGISIYKDGAVSVNPIVDMGIKVPAFAMRVDVATLTEGDIILNGNDTSFYKGKTEAGYEVVAMNGEVKQVGAITNLFFGKNTVLAIKNMMAGTGMNPLMLAMMMGDGADGKGFDMKTFALMSMMGAKQEGGGMDSNMLMMMALMGK